MGRRLVVNADDFGLSPAVSAGIVEAHERGIVTSTSLMVRMPAAAEAARMARGLSVGLHVDLGEWVRRDGEWVASYERVDGGDAEAVAAEVRAQLAAFRELTGRDPTHLDSHQHVHREEPARSAVLAAGEELGVPVRWFTPGLDTYGGFYGQDGYGEPLHENVTAEALVAVIESLPEGTTELMCHPGRSGDSGSVYDAERELELAALCDPRVVRAIEASGVELLAFADLRRGSVEEQPR